VLTVKLICINSVHGDNVMVTYRCAGILEYDMPTGLANVKEGLCHKIVAV